MYKKIFYRLMLPIISIILIGCAFTSKITYNSPKSIKNAINSTVKISVDYIIQDKITLATVQKSYFATGFSIANTKSVSFILTNKHVCNMESKANYVLTLQTGKKFKASFIRNDDFADICLLKTDANVQPFSLSKENGSQGDRVVTIGGQDGVFPFVVDGIIAGYYNMHMENEEDNDNGFGVHFRAQVISTPTYPGGSGSPVLNVNGEVIGIVFAARDGKEHITIIVPVTEVLRFLNVEEFVYMN